MEDLRVVEQRKEIAKANIQSAIGELSRLKDRMILAIIDQIINWNNEIEREVVETSAAEINRLSEHELKDIKRSIDSFKKSNAESLQTSLKSETRLWVHSQYEANRVYDRPFHQEYISEFDRQIEKVMERLLGEIGGVYLQHRKLRFKAKGESRWKVDSGITRYVGSYEFSETLFGLMKDYKSAIEGLSLESLMLSGLIHTEQELKAKSKWDSV